MSRCDRIYDLPCEGCFENTGRKVKTSPKSCLPKENYQSCHIFCKPCWEKRRWNYYWQDDEKKKHNYSCYICLQQKCWHCNSIGEWHADIRKVLCYDCL